VQICHYVMQLSLSPMNFKSLALESMQMSHTVVVFLGRGMVGTTTDDVPHMFRLHVDRHSPDDSVCGRLLSRRPEAHGTCCGHSHIQLLGQLRVLRKSMLIFLFYISSTNIGSHLKYAVLKCE
jgi:hypothetical protein